MSSVKFDAPRPTVTNRLGKKRTEELIRADGDTWQEYLAVSEKPQNQTKTSNGSALGGALSFFGKKNKKKLNATSKSSPSKTNDSEKNNLIVRSYFQNLRTGRKVWDEPPSGASKIIPASEEMRRMAEMQLGELCVVTVPASNGGDLKYPSKDTSMTNSINSATSSKSKIKKSGIFRKGSTKTSEGANAGRNGENSSSAQCKRRIRYKPNSDLCPPAAKPSRRSESGRRRGEGETLNDRQLREAIERSMADTSGPAAYETESSEELLRRALEESRLEALESARRRRNSYVDDDDRKPPARKHPPQNNNKYKTSATNNSKGNDRRRHS